MSESADPAVNLPAPRLGKKPGNAKYRGKVTAYPDGTVEVVPDPEYSDFPHKLDAVEIAWYEKAVKVTFKKAGPAAITQSYLSGYDDDVIIELRPSATLWQ